MSLPDFEDVKVDLNIEIERLAAKDGIENKKLLETSIQMTRREYYAASIIQWYRGRDQGYMEGVADSGSFPLRRIASLVIAGVIIGACITTIIALTLAPHAR